VGRRESAGGEHAGARAGAVAPVEAGSMSMPITSCDAIGGIDASKSSLLPWIACVQGPKKRPGDAERSVGGCGTGGGGG